ncbi:CBS domain-containing protein [bacterium]|nr:CBS domain-containing protein [bacterium]
MQLKKIVEGREPYFVRTHFTIREVVKYMAQKNIGAVAVFTRDNQLAGIFSERDIMKRVVAADLNPDKVLISEVMTKKVYVGTPDEDFEACLQRMKTLNVRHLPIFENGIEYLGLVSLRDLLLIGIDTKDMEIQYLSSYIHNTP